MTLNERKHYPSRSTCVAHALSIALFLSLNPYFIWGLEQHVRVALFAPLCLIALLHLRRGVPSSSFLVALTYIGLTVWLSLPLADGIQGYPLFNIALAACLLTASQQGQSRIFETFKSYYAASLIPGLLFYFVLLLGFDFSYSIHMPPAGGDALTYYRIYPGYVVMEKLIYAYEGLSLSRFSGMLDEPGHIGTISALILCAQHLDLKERRSKIILVAGILSLSLAFFGILLVYMALTKRKAFFGIGAAAAAGIYIFQPEWFFNLPIIQRFTFVDGHLLAYNRTSIEFDVIYQDSLNHADVWTLLFGHGNAAHTLLGTGLSSYKSVIYNNGFLGLCLYALFFSLLTLAVRHRDRRTGGSFIVVFALSFLQRPEVLGPAYLLFYIAALLPKKTTVLSRPVTHQRAHAQRPAALLE